MTIAAPVIRAAGMHTDLIVNGCAMPGWSGLASAAEILRERPAPVVLIPRRHDVETLAAVGVHVSPFLSGPGEPKASKTVLHSAATGASSAEERPPETRRSRRLVRITEGYLAGNVVRVG